MGQGLNFGDGLGAAARNLYGLQQDLRQEGRPVLGGPDDAFEIYTDPQTGERSYKPVKEFVEYNENKRTKQKDVADINGRVMRSEERRGGKECVRTCRYRWSPDD